MGAQSPTGVTWLSLPKATYLSICRLVATVPRVKILLRLTGNT
jgi:hypothetical protein